MRTRISSTFPSTQTTVGNSFTNIQPDVGTTPVADNSNDTLTITSPDGSILVSGDSTTDTISLSMVQKMSRVAVSASAAIGVTYQYLGVSCGASCGISLAPGTSMLFKMLYIKDESLFASLNNIALFANGSDLVEGSSMYVLNIDGECAALFYGSTNRISII